MYVHSHLHLDYHMAYRMRICTCNKLSNLDRTQTWLTHATRGVTWRKPLVPSESHEICYLLIFIIEIYNMRLFLLWRICLKNISITKQFIVIKIKISHYIKYGCGILNHDYAVGQVPAYFTWGFNHCCVILETICGSMRK